MANKTTASRKSDAVSNLLGDKSVADAGQEVDLGSRPATRSNSSQPGTVCSGSKSAASRRCRGPERFCGR